MFGNLKSKIGDVTDLRRYAAPQSLSSRGGSRQRSMQPSPGTVTPQPSTLPPSPPQSPTTQQPSDREVELEREVSKLRAALEVQQDGAVERLAAKEQEWRGRLAEERERATSQLQALQAQHSLLQAQVPSLTSALHQSQERVKGLEAKLCQLQDNCDQMEGLNTQELAKVKHLLLNTNSQLEAAQAELTERQAAAAATEARLTRASSLEGRLTTLTEEKTELESQVAGLHHKLTSLQSRYKMLEEGKEEEVQHLQSRITTLEQRHSQAALQESDKVQALIKEREGMEHNLEEVRQQLNNIKSSWSDKISSLEAQIHHLNAKIAEDQVELQQLEESNAALSAHNTQLQQSKEEEAAAATSAAAALADEVDSLRWQLNTSREEAEQQQTSLSQQLTEAETSHQECQAVLQSKLEMVAQLEQQVVQQEGQLSGLQERLAGAESDVARGQREVQGLQEALRQERASREGVERARAEAQAKLEVLSGEKVRLSANLDQYVEQVSSLQREVGLLTEQAQDRSRRLEEVEGQLAVAEQQCRELQGQLHTAEEDLEQRVESSPQVLQLRAHVKTLEDDLAQTKQALKVQGQRLADMKKTIQRELKLSADTVDSAPAPSTAAPTLPPHQPSAVPTPVDTRTDVQLPEASTNGPASFSPSADGSGPEVNHTYLKHVIIKYLTSREPEAVHLTRAVATLLHMTAEEEQLLRQTLEWKMSWFGSRPNLGKGQESLTIPPSH